MVGCCGIVSDDARHAPSAWAFQTLQGAISAASAPCQPGDALTKVVLARRSDVTFRGRLDPLALLAALQVAAAV